jgi:hypothetical protein
VLLTFAAEHSGKRLKDDLHVQEETPMADVPEIHVHVDIEGRTSPCLDLPKAGEARLHHASLHVFRLVTNYIIDWMRSGADDTHFPTDHINDLRQLVNAVAPNEGTDARKARVVEHLESWAVTLVAVSEPLLQIVRVYHHRPELVTKKQTAFFADAK